MLTALRCQQPVGFSALASGRRRDKQAGSRLSRNGMSPLFDTLLLMTSTPQQDLRKLLKLES